LEVDVSKSLLICAFLLVGAAAQAADKSWDIDEVMGRPDAPITIVEYSSLTCPHCAKFHADTLPQLKKEWIDTGKARLVMRDFVWDPLAQAAAMISHCSGDRYFAFVDTYFHSQQTWTRAAQPLDALKGIARLGGMSGEEVDKCLQNKALLGAIMMRKDEGEKLYGIDSTPSFVINGKMMSGDKDYDSFAKILAAQKK
jgi:protein-disulfide isomerase